MADLKISALTAATVAAGANEIPVNEAGSTKKITVTQLATAILPVKASGSEVDTGTDDAKFLTAASVNNSHNVPSVAPGTTGNVLTSDGTDWTSAAPAGGSSTAIFALIDPQVNVSSIGDTYTDTAGNTYAETTNQTRITLHASRVVNTGGSVSGHVSAGTGTFQLWNFTESSELANKTTTSTTEVNVGVLLTTAASSTLGDSITLRVKNSGAGGTITIDSGGITASDIRSNPVITVISTTTVPPSLAAPIAGTYISNFKYILLKCLSSSTITMQPSIQGTQSFNYYNFGTQKTEADYNTIISESCPLKAGSVTPNITVITGAWLFVGSVQIKSDNI